MSESNQWFPDITNEEYNQQKKNIRAIQANVAARTGQRADWIARQRKGSDNQNWIGIAFVVGKEALFLTNEDVMHDPDDTAFIDKLAEEVLGYPPDGEQYLLLQFAECNHEEDYLTKQIQVLHDQRRAISHRRFKLRERLITLGVNDPYERVEQMEQPQQGGDQS